MADNAPVALIRGAQEKSNKEIARALEPWHLYRRNASLDFAGEAEFTQFRRSCALRRAQGDHFGMRNHDALLSSQA
jgi:hypothetical protein